MKIAEFKALQFGTKSLRYFECNKSYDRLHPGTTAQNSSQIPVEAQGFVGCIMIYSYHQMCLALKSKPYWSNKQVMPLLGCCSDAPGSPGNHLVICGERTFFQLNFGVQSMLEIYLVKIAALLQHFVAKNKTIWCIVFVRFGHDSHATANWRTFFFFKIC